MELSFTLLKQKENLSLSKKNSTEKSIWSMEFYVHRFILNS